MVLGLLGVREHVHTPRIQRYTEVKARQKREPFPTIYLTKINNLITSPTPNFRLIIVGCNQLNSSLDFTGGSSSPGLSGPLQGRAVGEKKVEAFSVGEDVGYQVQ